MIFVLGNHRYTIADPRRCPRAMILHLRAVLALTDFDRVEPGPDEAPDDFLNRKAETAVAVATPFVAAMLVPEGRSEADWSPELARRTERRLRRLEGPAVQGEYRGSGAPVRKDPTRRCRPARAGTDGALGAHP